MDLEQVALDGGQQEVAVGISAGAQVLGSQPWMGSAPQAWGLQQLTPACLSHLLLGCAYSF